MSLLLMDSQLTVVRYKNRVVGCTLAVDNRQSEGTILTQASQTLRDLWQLHAAGLQWVTGDFLNGLRDRYTHTWDQVLPDPNRLGIRAQLDTVQNGAPCATGFRLPTAFTICPFRTTRRRLTLIWKFAPPCWRGPFRRAPAGMIYGPKSIVCKLSPDRFHPNRHASESDSTGDRRVDGSCRVG